MVAHKGTINATKIRVRYDNKVVFCDMEPKFEFFQDKSSYNFDKKHTRYYPGMDYNNSGRRIYPFNKGLRIYGGGYHPPFDRLKIGTSTHDIKLKLYR